MGIMELGAIGELVGAVAVIGSLIFVGAQLRQPGGQDSWQRQRSHMTSSFVAYADQYLATLDAQAA